ncbi:MAG: PEGA domain-containing protein [Deltaproteobacteria bacterium]|nr:PEGA domain-containing protein [Deltaproteobacteria bacterium]
MARRATAGAPWLAAVVVLSSLTFSAGAQPEVEAQARRLFEEGVASAAAGDWTTAIANFEGSYALFPQPGTLKNIAVYQDQAGRHADAHRSWTELLERYGDVVSETTRAEAAGRIAALERYLGTVTLTSNVEGTTLLVDGRDVGMAPLAAPLRLEPGTHVFEGRMDGHQDARISVLLLEGAASPVQLVLLPMAVVPSVLRVEVRTAGALVSIDDASPEPAALTREVAPGPHRVRVEAPGFIGETREVIVPSSGQVVVSFDLAPLIVPTPATPEDTEGFWSGPWPWIIGGVLLAGAGAATTTVLLWPEDEPALDLLLRVR